MDYDLMLELIKAKKNGRRIYYRRIDKTEYMGELPQNGTFNFSYFEYSLTKFTQELEYPVIFIKEYSNGELYAHKTLEEAQACTDEEGELKVYVGVDVLKDIITLLNSDKILLKNETVGLIDKLYVFANQVKGDSNGLK